MAAGQGTNIVTSYKKQVALGTPQSGSGGTALDVRPSAGLQLQTAQIQSKVLRRSKMMLRPRQGSNTVTAAYETELQVGNGDGIFIPTLGASAATASFTISNSDVTSMTITGATGACVGASGSFLSLNLVAGMMVKFAGLSVVANNGIWVPVLTVVAGQFTIPANLLADNATDTSFTMTVAKSIVTPTPYNESYYTFEQWSSDISRSKLGSDLKFNSLNFSAPPNDEVTFGFGLTGRAMTGGASQILTTPTYNAQSAPSSLVLLDGAFYRNGLPYGNVTGLKFGLQSNASITPLITSRTGPDVVLGDFALTGEVTCAVADGVDFNSFLAEDRISLFVRFAERESDPADFVSVYMGDTCFGGFSDPIADGQTIATMSIWGGEDRRGAGYAPSAMVISTSAA